MSVTVYWDTDEKRNIRQVYSVDWNWEEFLKAFDQMETLKEAQLAKA